MPLYQPRYMVQLMSQGTPYSQNIKGLTPSVAQCSNQSERSWTGTKSRYRLLVCMLPKLPEEWWYTTRVGSRRSTMAWAFRPRRAF